MNILPLHKIFCEPPSLYGLTFMNNHELLVNLPKLGSSSTEEYVKNLRAWHVLRLYIVNSSLTLRPICTNYNLPALIVHYVSECIYIHRFMPSEFHLYVKY